MSQHFCVGDEYRGVVVRFEFGDVLGEALPGDRGPLVCLELFALPPLLLQA